MPFILFYFILTVKSLFGGSSIKNMSVFLMFEQTTEQELS